MHRRRFLFTLLTLVAGAGLDAAAHAQEPPPFPQFTFKRIGLPQAGQPLITAQIDPDSVQPPPPPDPGDQPEVAGGADASTSDTQEADTYDWFWQVVSPQATAAGPLNFARALKVLRETPPLQPPRLQAMQDIAARHGTDILRATVGTSVSPALVVAMIAVESSGRAGATSGAGAQGLMQLMPDTAVRFGVADAMDASANIRGGVAYMSWLMNEFGRDPILALAAYNAGENAVRDAGGVPDYPETRGYVPKVLAAWQVARGLCVTPPELITDGCVFAVKEIASDG